LSHFTPQQDVAFTNGPKLEQDAIRGHSLSQRTHLQCAFATVLAASFEDVIDDKSHLFTGAKAQP
jgi:hypothetical protein